MSTAQQSIRVYYTLKAYREVGELLGANIQADFHAQLSEQFAKAGLALPPEEGALTGTPTADSLLALVERCAVPAKLAEDQSAQPASPYRTSIFEALKNARHSNQPYRFQVPELGFDKASHFPRAANNTVPSRDWEASFSAEISSLPVSSAEACLQNAQFLLETKAWGLRSKSDPVLSPAQLMRTRISFASALLAVIHDGNLLGDAHKTGIEAFVHTTGDVVDGQPPFCLIGGDLSGIQRFIYQISSTKASKSLKGRSFYVEALLKGIVLFLQTRLGLSPEHLIYSAGGGFYLLAPNTEAIHHHLRSLHQQLENAIFEKHGTTLYLALGDTQLTTGECIRGEVEKAWRRLSEELNAQKRRRYVHQLLPNGTSDSSANEQPLNFEAFFMPSDNGGDVKWDAVTGDEIDGKAHRIDDPQTDDAEIVVSTATQQQLDLAKKIRQPNVTWTFDVAEETTSETSGGKAPNDRFSLLDGLVYLWIREEKPGANQNASRDQAQDMPSTAVQVVRPNAIHADAKIPQPQVLSFYGGSDYPVKESGSGHYPEPKDFNELAGGSANNEEPDSSDRLVRLGVLRMDVDNLGQLFLSEFKKGERSLARYNSLSQSLDYFFAGYVSELRDHETYSDFCQVIYAGGDDLFVVGRWDLMIDLANEIRQDFEEWHCHHKTLSLSGGVAIVPGKFPISQAAKMAGDAEEAAKDHSVSLAQQSVTEKNSINLLGESLHWTHEFALVKWLKDDLVRFIEQESFDRSILKKLAQHYVNKQEAEQRSADNAMPNERWRWLMAYDLGRYRQRVKSDHQTAKNWLDDQCNAALYSQIPQAYQQEDFQVPSGFDYLRWLNIASRWAELHLRTGQGEQEATQDTVSKQQLTHETHVE